MTQVRIFFSAPGCDLTMRRILHITRKHPRIGYALWVSMWTRILTMEKETHVSVAHDGAVLDVTVHGIVYWPFIDYLMHYTGLLSFVTIETDRTLDLDKYNHMVGMRQMAWKTILKYYTGGLVRLSNDCTDLTRDCLRDIGIETPGSCKNPGALRRFLVSEGYRITILAPEASPDRGSVDP